MPEPVPGKPLPSVGQGTGVTVLDLAAPPAAGADETLLAFDFGTRKLGVALGNTVTRRAGALEIILAPTRDGRFARIAQLLADWQPQRLVVGLALTTAGTEQHASLQGRRFANQLHGRFGLPVVLVDERGSSMEAQAQLGTHAPEDAVAAAIILQRYLDAIRSFSDRSTLS